MPNLDPGQPRREISEDRLGYAPFAKMISDSIEKMIPPQGLVIGIYGDWGTGKSTAIEFIKKYLGEIEGDNAPVVMSFNPWLYTGTDRLLSGFFATLEAELNTKYQKLLRGIGDNIRKITRLATKLPVDLINLPEAIVEEYLTETISDVKERIVRQLEDSERRIVVIIDDIDRLAPSEITQLFAVIKSVADFPNIVYLLAFDEKIVSGAVGMDYIEKIVQVPFRLPTASKESLQQLFLEGINEIVGNIPEELEDRFWGVRGYLSALSNILNTPRKVIRLLNSFRVTYAAAREEVNTVDFLFLEVIRVFYPQIYTYISNNEDLFTGESVSNVQLETFRQLIATVQQDKQNFLELLLKAMFPKFNTAYATDTLDVSGNVKARREARIQSHEKFYLYFGLGLKLDRASRADIQSILTSVSNTNEFTEKLIAYSRDNSIKLASLLLELHDYAFDAPRETLILMLEGLLNATDVIIESVQEQLEEGRAVNGRIRFVILLLLQRLSNNNDFDVIYSIFDQTSSVSYLLDLLIEIHQRDGWFPLSANSSFPLIPGDKVSLLNPLIFRKLSEHGDKELPIAICSAIPVIELWYIEDSIAARTWLTQYLNAPDYLYDFLQCFQRRKPLGEMDRFITYRSVITQLETYLRNEQYKGEKKAFVENWIAQVRRQLED